MNSLFLFLFFNLFQFYLLDSILSSISFSSPSPSLSNRTPLPFSLFQTLPLQPQLSKMISSLFKRGYKVKIWRPMTLNLTLFNSYCNSFQISNNDREGILYSLESHPQATDWLWEELIFNWLVRDENNIFRWWWWFLEQNQITMNNKKDCFVKYLST